jgi:integrase/recombinase XerD
VTKALPLEAEAHLAWLAAERGRSANTLAAYRRDLAQYVEWLGGTPLERVEAQHLERYVAHLRNQQKAPASIARALVAVRGLHRFLAEEGDTDGDPGADVASPRVPRGLPKALSEEEVGRLLSAVVGWDPPARRDRAILEVLYGTGMRISELVGLSLGDLDLEDGTVRAFGKGAKERIVPLMGLANQAMEEWLAPSGRGAMTPARWARRGDAEAVFLNVRGGRLTRQGAWLVIRKHGDRVGLGDRLTPHVLRHSCATHLLDHGADIRVVQELLGHASISTTQVYTLVSQQRLVDAYTMAHPRARGVAGRQGTAGSIP